jgi:hypothetical protein
MKVTPGRLLVLLEMLSQAGNFPENHELYVGLPSQKKLQLEIGSNEELRLMVVLAVGIEFQHWEGPKVLHCERAYLDQVALPSYLLSVNGKCR